MDDNKIPRWGRKMISDVDRAGRELDAQGEIHGFYKQRHYKPPEKDRTNSYWLAGLSGGMAALALVAITAWIFLLRTPSQPTYPPQPPSLEALPIR